MRQAKSLEPAGRRVVELPVVAVDSSKCSNPLQRCSARLAGSVAVGDSGGKRTGDGCTVVVDAVVAGQGELAAAVVVVDFGDQSDSWSHIVEWSLMWSTSKILKGEMPRFKYTFTEGKR